MRKAHLLLLAGLVPAVSTAALNVEPAKFGDNLQATPLLNIGIASDDNFYTEPSGAEDDSLIYTINPEIELRNGDEERNGRILVSVTQGFVDIDSDDNFTDYKLNFSGNQPIAPKLTLGAGVGTTAGHDGRGASSSTDACQVGVIVGPATACDAEPDTWRQNAGNIDLTFGAKNAPGSVKFGAKLSSKTYSNNEPRTDALEYDNSVFFVNFGWKMSGKSKAVLETSYTEYDYASTFDNTQSEVLVGVEWQALSSLNGYAKVGTQSKKFDNPASEDINDPAWKVGLTFTPSKRTTLNLDLSQGYEEGQGVADAKIVTRSALKASTLITDRVEPYISYSNEETEYDGAAVPRTDELTKTSIGVDYKMRRFAVLGLSWSGSDMSSNAGALLEYDRSVIAFNAKLSL